VRLIQESVWLTLNQIADLLQRDKSVISKHIKNIFDTGKLDPARTVAKFATVQTEGVTREIAARRPVPPMGNEPAQRVLGQGLRHGRLTPEAGWRRLL